jgi:hypothetical protein
MWAKKPGKGHKHKVQEVESESEDNSSQLDSNPVLRLEILGINMVVTQVIVSSFAVMPCSRLCHDLRYYYCY